MKKLAVAMSIYTFTCGFNVTGMCPIENKVENSSILQTLPMNPWTRTHAQLHQWICLARSVSDYEAIRNFIQKTDFDIDACDVFGNTLLHQAAITKDTRILEALLDKNPQNINASNIVGLTALSNFLASFYTYSGYNISVNTTADWNEQNQEKILTPQFVPSFYSRMPNGSAKPMIEKFLAHGADVRTKDSFIGITPLHYATLAGDMDALLTLINYKPSAINVTTNDHISLVDIAVNTKDILITNLLTRRGAKVKFENLKKSLDNPDLLKALLPYAHSLLNVESGTKILAEYPLNCFDEEVISFLIDKGADINVSTSLGISLLDAAVNTKNLPLIEFLVKEGAKVKLINLKNSINNLELLKVLIPYRDSLSKIENGDKILAEYSFDSFNEEIISFLIDQGANVDAKNEDQLSFLYRFAQRYSGNNEKFIEKIVRASRNIDAQYDWGHTALAVAVLWKNFTVAKKLFEAGADPTIPDRIGFSAKNLAKLYEVNLFKPKPKRKRVSSFF
jgi:ankyrin repeat protein